MGAQFLSNFTSFAILIPHFVHFKRIEEQFTSKTKKANRFVDKFSTMKFIAVFLLYYFNLKISSICKNFEKSHVYIKLQLVLHQILKILINFNQK